MRGGLQLASLLLVAWGTSSAGAQSGTAPAAGTAAQKDPAGDDVFRVDIAVPEAPAFLLAGGEASGLLRPSTVRDFSAAFGDFTDKEGRFTLPASFAVEIAPHLLFFGRSLTVQRYAGVPDDIDNPLPRANRTDTLWYRREPPANLGVRAWSTLRVSLATHRPAGQDQPTRVALGFRTSPINDADPRLNAEHRRQMRRLLAARNQVNTDLALRRCKITGGLVSPPGDAPAPPERTPPDFGTAVKVATCLTTQPDRQLETLPKLAEQRDLLHASITAARNAFAEGNWNQRTLEFAGAFSLSAQDSTGRSPRPAEYAAWGTYTHPLRSWAQGLLGARFRSARDTLTDERGAEWLLGGRLYMGRNTAKALIEAQLPLGHDLGLNPYAGLGAEVRVLPELWATFSAGVERAGDDRSSRLVTRFSVRSGKPNIQASPTLSQRTP